MAIQVYAGTFTEHTDTGSNSETGVGFQPETLVFWGSDVVGDGNSADAHATIAMATSSLRRTCQMSVSNTTTDRYFRHAGSMYSRSDADNTLLYNINYTSLDADGFTGNVTTASATEADVHYLAIAGADNVAVHQFTASTSTGTQNVTGVGFQPDVVMILGIGLSTAPTSSTTAGGLGICFATGSNQWGQSSAFTTTHTLRVSSITSPLLMHVAGASALYVGSVTGMTADGFDLNWTTAGNPGRVLHALCIKGGSHKVGNYTTPTSTDANFAVTGVGFQPTALLQCSIGHNGVGYQLLHAKTNFGGATGTSNEGAISGGKDGALAASSSHSAHDATKTYIDLDPGTPTYDEQASLVSFDADGFTQNFSTAQGLANYVGYWVIGEAAVAAVGGGSSMNLLGVGT